MCAPSPGIACYILLVHELWLVLTMYNIVHMTNLEDGRLCNQSNSQWRHFTTLSNKNLPRRRRCCVIRISCYFQELHTVLIISEFIDELLVLRFENNINETEIHSHSEDM